MSVEPVTTEPLQQVEENQPIMDPPSPDHASETESGVTEEDTKDAADEEDTAAEEDTLRNDVNNGNYTIFFYSDKGKWRQITMVWAWSSSGDLFYGTSIYNRHRLVDAVELKMNVQKHELDARSQVALDMIQTSLKAMGQTTLRSDRLDEAGKASHQQTAITRMVKHKKRISVSRLREILKEKMDFAESRVYALDGGVGTTEQQQEAQRQFARMQTIYENPRLATKGVISDLIRKEMFKRGKYERSLRDLFRLIEHWAPQKEEEEEDEMPALVDID